jgi:LPXTG-motif cell wall-anchored protein
MKRVILALSTVLVLTASVAVAQSTLNTRPAGPTQEKEPGLTNNNLPNPGNPVPSPGDTEQQPMAETSTAQATAPSTQSEPAAPVEPAYSGAQDQDTQSTPATADSDERLPQTGSDMPLVALIGLTSLGAALALKSLRG